MPKQQIRNILSENIRKLRNRREWSQMELAEKANISMNYLSEIERSNKWPYPEKLQNIADALEVKVYELFMPESELMPDIHEYMNRFSNDVDIAIQEAVKKTLKNIKQLYTK
jgi:transcriptional regulator with XRE-family HTH domain